LDEKAIRRAALVTVQRLASLPSFACDCAETKGHREARSAFRHYIGSARKLRREIAAFVAVELPILLAHHAVPLHRVSAPEQRR